MRPIPAPRLGDSHGLMRAVDRRERLRLDEFMTEFSVEELYPPGLENAIGRTRQFLSFARAAGLLKEDHGVVELTDVGRRYIRAGDAAQPFDVAPAQAEWLRRRLREQHMADTIYHGLAIALSLLASSPGAQVRTLDFGRALNHLGRAGWDNENTLEIQGERHLTLLRDMELIDAAGALTATGTELKGELTLPVHMSLVDVVAQFDPRAPAPVEETPIEIVQDLPSEEHPVPRAHVSPRPEPSAPPVSLGAGDAIRAAAVERDLELPDSTYAGLATALADRHVLIVGPPASGKTELALAAAGPDALLVAGGSLDHVLAAARGGRWLVIDDLIGAPAPNAFLAGHRMLIGGEELSAPPDWRIVATAREIPAGLGSQFAVVQIGDHPDLEGALDVAPRLLAVRQVATLGAGAYLAAAAYVAARSAELPRADDAVLAREAFTAYLAPLLDADTAARAHELLR